MGYGFSFVKNRGNAPQQDLENIIIAASTTLTIGDAVRLTTGATGTGGYAYLAGAGNAIYGIVEGFVDKNGNGLDSSKSDYDGTYTPGSCGIGTYVSTSDNLTDKQIAVLVRTDKNAIYKAQLDDTINTTTGSGVRGYNIDIPAASDILDEDTATTSSAQMQIIRTDPNTPTTHVWVMIKEGYI